MSGRSRSSAGVVPVLAPVPFFSCSSRSRLTRLTALTLHTVSQSSGNPLTGMPIALIFGLQLRAYRTARVGSKTYRNRCQLMLGPISFADCWSGINARVRMPLYSHAAPTARLCLHLLWSYIHIPDGTTEQECAPLYVRAPEGDERASGVAHTPMRV